MRIPTILCSQAAALYMLRLAPHESHRAGEGLAIGEGAGKGAEAWAGACGVQKTVCCRFNSSKPHARTLHIVNKGMPASAFYANCKTISQHGFKTSRLS